MIPIEANPNYVDLPNIQNTSMSRIETVTHNISKLRSLEKNEKFREKKCNKIISVEFVVYSKDVRCMLIKIIVIFISPQKI